MNSVTTEAVSPRTLSELKKKRVKLKNTHKEVTGKLKPLERFAIFITDRVGTMGFFLIIFFWTFLWCGYNIIASELPSLGLVPFDPFPAFVAYLLISNVIQILLMPLIMVGQNLQGRHSEARAEHDLEVNIKAEQEIEVILLHLENQQDLILKQQALLTQLVEKLGGRLDVVLEKPRG